MKRITVILPDDLAALLDHEAVARGANVSEVVRASLRIAMLPNSKRALPFAAICDDPTLATGAATDEALEADWAGELDRGGR